VRDEAHSWNAHGYAERPTSWRHPHDAKAEPAGGRPGALTRLEPGEHGAQRRHFVTAGGSKPESDDGYARHLAGSVLTLNTRPNDGKGVRHRVAGRLQAAARRSGCARPWTLCSPNRERDLLNCCNGFHPRRRTMDGIALLDSDINPRTKYYWVIEGDIKVGLRPQGPWLAPGEATVAQ
jgi:hypothetical protein